jgi:hypothetical protein
MRSLQEYRQYLREVTVIQTETIRRLIADDATPPLEMAAVLEDIANLFLDISDDIRDYALGHQSVVLQLVQDTPAEADPA